LVNVLSVSARASRFEAGYFVGVRRSKSVSTHFSSARQRAIADARRRLRRLLTNLNQLAGVVAFGGRFGPPYTEHVESTTNRETHMTATDQTFETETVADGVILTDQAAAKVKALLEGEGRDDLSLRLAVQPGGCSGLRYQLFFDERSLEGDIVKEFGGVNVVTDRMSAPYLMGATIDFVDTIERQGFTIDNPNATGSCACGDSFH
jgi:iron-sulfur cluster assembly accessory protein